MVKFPTKLEDLVPPAAIGKVLDILNQPVLAATVREALHKVGMKDGSPVEQVQHAWHQARGWLESVAQRMLDISQVNPAIINATGQLVQPQWNCLPVKSSVAEAIAAASSSFQDYDKIHAMARRIATTVTGGEDVIFSTSLPVAIETLCRLSAFNQGLITPRTDAIRIPGFLDVRELLRQGPSPLIEIGAVNSTSNSDWPSNKNQGNQAIVLVSPNCLDISDSAAQRSVAISVAKSLGAVVVEILFDGVITDNSNPCMNLPRVADRLASGTDLVIVPLDWFIGGPTGALIAGKASLVAAMDQAMRHRGLVMRGPDLAGVSAAIKDEGSGPESPSGIGRLLATSVENLENRARRLVVQIEGTPKVKSIVTRQRPCRIGPPPWSRYHLASCAVLIEPTGSVAHLRNELMTAPTGPSIMTGEEDGLIMLDLRWVEASQDHFLVSALLGETTSSF